jgi:predicted nuclease with TOPRIM domain
MSLKDLEEKIKAMPLTKMHWKLAAVLLVLIVVSFVAWRCDIASYKEKINKLFPASEQMRQELDKSKAEAIEFMEKSKVLEIELQNIKEAKAKADYSLKVLRTNKATVTKELANADKNKALVVLADDFKRYGYSPVLVTR